MSDSQVSMQGYGERELPDYLDLVANVLYAVTGLLFVVGLWVDWQNPGQKVIGMFALDAEPNANSGLFIAAVIVLAVAYVISKLADKVVEWRTEEVDETQEWTVDVGE
ncbi:MAG: hypothetical protein ABEJ34_03020 [Haloferacaceae archaeon]